MNIFRQIIIILSILLFGSLAYADTAPDYTYLDKGGQSVGEILGNVINDVVLNIRAQDPNSRLSHAHVMAIMCQELPSLNTKQLNSEGRLEGYTQVIDSTYKGLINGTIANGACSYIANLENGECADPDSRIKNARCSIELGACLFNTLLERCNGDVVCAYNAYNTGSPNRRANGLSDFVQGYQNLASGKVCAKARYNKPVWDGIYNQVAKLTGGKFDTDLAMYVPMSPKNLKTSVEDAIFGSSNTGKNTGMLDKLKNILGINSGGGTSQTYSGNNSDDVITGNTLLSDGGPKNYKNQDELQPPPAGASVTLDPDKGAMYCIPRELTKNEQFLLTYLCPNGTEFEKSVNFEATAPYGVIKLRSMQSQEYAIICKKPDGSKITASCAVNVK